MNFSASIAGGGSTFAAPLENAGQAYYTARNSNATLAGYQAVGSGAGETGILNNTFNFGGSDVPMAQSDIAAREPNGDNYTLSQFEQVPIGLGGEAIAYNLPGFNTKEHLNLNATVIAEIYLGKITKWNAPQIAALNTKKLNPTLKSKLPNHAIDYVCRADSSGTTYIFTNFLGTAAPHVWKTVPSKNALTLVNSGDLAGSGNAGVAADVVNNKYTIGYVEYSYVLLNPKLKAGVAAILNKSNKWVVPSTTGIQADAAKHPGISTLNLKDYSIVFESGAASYPIAGYTWAIVWQTQTNFDQGTLLVKYLDWLAHSEPAKSGLKAGQDVAGEQGYVPLPANIQALATATLLKVKGPADQTLLTKNGN
jgi:phosphate transport system substrate-binding protein